MAIVFLLKGYSQSAESMENYVVADEKIDSLVQLHIAYNTEHPTIDGYRIHIFIESGNDALVKAEQVKERFEERYKHDLAYISFREPYYLVRVGDFRTRLDAEKFLQRINRTYRNAWVTTDKINLPVLPNYQKN